MLSGSRSAVEKIARKHNLGYVSQLTAHQPALPGQAGELLQLPYFIVNIDGLLLQPRKNLDAMAIKQGLDGHVEFIGAESAALFSLALQICQDGSSSGCTASVLALSSLFSIDGAPLVEGDREPAPGYAGVATPSPYFWWVAAPGEYPTFAGSNLFSLNGANAWTYAEGAGTRMAVIDDGFLLANRQDPTVSQELPYLYNAVGDNYDVAGPGVDTTDLWHGRRIASLAFAPHNDSAGTVGVAPRATPLFIKCGGPTPYGLGLPDEAIARAIECAIGWRADVINMSFGAQRPWGNAITCPYYASVKRAYEKGIIMVAATGNSGDQGNVYPSAFWEVLSVSSHDQQGNRAPHENGIDADIFAPGVNVATSVAPDYVRPNSFHSKSGTSVSAPIVSGTVALCLERAKFSHKMEPARDWLKAKSSHLSCGPALNIAAALR